MTTETAELAESRVREGEGERGVGASKTDATQLQWAPKGPLVAAPIASDPSASPAWHCYSRQARRQAGRGEEEAEVCVEMW